jgi:DNA-directed RNA polymerase subunit K/omega
MSLATLNLPKTSDEEITPKEQRKTLPFLTEYEHSQILGLRANEIDRGLGSPVQKFFKEYTVDPLLVAEVEYDLGWIDYKVRRVLPSGKIEIIPIIDLAPPPGWSESDLTKKILDNPNINITII